MNKRIKKKKNHQQTWFKLVNAERVMWVFESSETKVINQNIYSPGYIRWRPILKKLNLRKDQCAIFRSGRVH